MLDDAKTELNRQGAMSAKQREILGFVLLASSASWRLNLRNSDFSPRTLTTPWLARSVTSPSPTAAYCPVKRRPSTVDSDTATTNAVPLNSASTQLSTPNSDSPLTLVAKKNTARIVPATLKRPG